MRDLNAAAIFRGDVSESAIERAEVVARLFDISDIAAAANALLDLLEGDGEEEDDTG